MKQIISILIAVILMLGIFGVCTIVNAADGEITWTDFSNAKYEIAYYNAGNSYINISGVKKNNSTYYWFITSDNTKPQFNENNTSNYNIVDINVGNVEFGRINAVDYLELNQDIYLWVVEGQRYNGEMQFNFVVEGKKIERTGYYKDYRLFASGFMITSDSDIINLKDIAWGNHARNMNLKIGKISDNTLLNKLKNNENGAFDDLLKYSKSNKTIYNNKLTTSTHSTLNYTTGYSTMQGTSEVIQIPQASLENKAYYFIYVELDDENGKYYPVEGVTIGQVNIIKDGQWSIFPYGNNSFLWENISSSSSETPSTPSNSPSTTNGVNSNTESKGKTDNTVATKILPYAGKNIMIFFAISIVIILAVISIKKYIYLREVK